MALSYSSLAASVPNWQLLQTATPSSVATVTISGLSGYSKYRILAPNLVATGTPILQLRLNGDSGTNYTNGTVRNTGGSSSTLISGALSYINLATSLNSSVPSAVQVDIDHALLLAPKFVSGTSSEAFAINTVAGFYVTTVALTSITLLVSASYFSTGTIYLLGAN